MTPLSNIKMTDLCWNNANDLIGKHLTELDNDCLTNFDKEKLYLVCSEKCIMLCKIEKVIVMGGNKGYYVMVYDDIYIFDETEIRHKKTTVEIISYTNNLQIFELEMNDEVLQKLKL